MPSTKLSTATRRSGLQYRYVVEFHRSMEDVRRKRPLATAPLQVDLVPAVQCAGFEALRNELTDSLPGERQEFEFQPRWHSLLGQPYTGGARVMLGGTGYSTSVDLPEEFFGTAVRTARLREIHSGQIDPADELVQLVTAYASQTSDAGDNGGLQIESIQQRTPIHSGSARELLRRSEANGELQNDFPVFVRRGVLQEATRLMTDAGLVEVGGILLGHLFRDRETRDLYAVIGAQIFAEHAQSEPTQLTFTSETWTQARMAIELRGGDEIWCGLWHSHPNWCSQCPVENRKHCRLSGEFFSLQDELLHRTVFPQAYAVGLVVSDSATLGITWPMFGWRRGIIARRGYYVLNDD